MIYVVAEKKSVEEHNYNPYATRDLWFSVFAFEQHSILRYFSLNVSIYFALIEANVDFLLYINVLKPYRGYYLHRKELMYLGPHRRHTRLGLTASP